MALREQAFETLVGAGVLIAAGAFLAFALTSTDSQASGRTYPLVAHFPSVNGLSTGSDVRLSGVKVGAVSAIDLDPKTYMAKVEMAVSSTVKVPDDSTAKVTTDGLLGGAFLSIEPGSSEAMLASGGEFQYAQGSVDLLTLFSQVAGGGAGQSAPAP